MVTYNTLKGCTDDIASQTCVIYFSAFQKQAKIEKCISFCYPTFKEIVIKVIESNMSETKKTQQANIRATAETSKVQTKDISTFQKKKINFICGDS